MNIIDMKTLVLNQSLTYIVCMIVVGLLWQQNRQRFSGLGFWLAGFAMQTISIVLIALRGIIPDWLSIVLGGAMVPISGAILLYIGLEQFVGLPSRQIHNIALLLFAGAIHAYFAFGQPNLAVRNINFSVTTIIINLQIAWLMLRRVNPELRPMTNRLGWIFIVFALINFGRIIVNLTLPVGNDFLKANNFADAALFLAFQVFFFAIAFSLFLMINQRLFWDLSSQQSALQKSETRYRQLVEFSPDAIFVFHNGKVILANPAAANLMHASSPEQLMGREILDFVHPEYHVIISQWLNHVHSSRQTTSLLEEKFIRVDGAVINVEVTTAPLDFQGQPAFQFIVRDITERKQNELRLLQLNRAVEQSPASIVLTDLDGKITYVNPHFLTLTGYSFEEAIGQHTRILKSGHTVPETYAEMWKTIVSGTVWKGEFLNKKKNGDLYWEQDTIAPVFGPDGNLISFVAVKEDITKQKQMAAELERLATTDPLTGVYNRREFARLAKIELVRASRYNHPTSMLMMDADYFKKINDTFGHVVGDRVLVALAQLLTRELRTSDLVARYGGEEFMLLLPETTITNAQDIGERIRRTVEDTAVTVDAQTIRFTISMGVTSSESIGQDFESLLKEADRLLYQAKQSGRNQVVAHN